MRGGRRTYGIEDQEHISNGLKNEGGNEGTTTTELLEATQLAKEVRSYGLDQRRRSIPIELVK